MRIIIAGCRSFNSYTLLKKEADRIISYLTQNSTTDEREIEIVSRGAKGADKLGERFAVEHEYFIKVFTADWSTYGRKAGIVRNKHMAEYAAEDDGVLIAFWDCESKGTKSMIKLANQNHLKVYIVRYITLSQNTREQYVCI